jgi:hypothetical protein
MKFNACYIYNKSKIKSDFGTDVVVENLQRIFKDRINIRLINQKIDCLFILDKKLTKTRF